MPKQPKNLFDPAERLALRRERLRQLGCLFDAGELVGYPVWVLPGGVFYRGKHALDEDEALAWLAEQEKKP